MACEQDPGLDALVQLRVAMGKLREDKDSAIKLRQVEIDHLKYHHG